MDYRALSNDQEPDRDKFSTQIDLGPTNTADEQRGKGLTRVQCGAGAPGDVKAEGSQALPFTAHWEDGEAGRAAGVIKK